MESVRGTILDSQPVRNIASLPADQAGLVKGPNDKRPFLVRPSRSARRRSGVCHQSIAGVPVISC